MELNSQTSFIPKKPLTDVKIHGNGMGFFSLIAFVIFLGSLFFAGGVYVYKIAIEKDIQAQKKNLEQTNSTLDKSFINTIVRFNSRIETSKVLLKKHVALTSIFDFLEQNTVSSITFKNFSFKPNTDGSLYIEMAGSARDYDSIAQQSDEFGRSGLLKDVIFSDLNPSLEGDIQFIFKAKLDPKLISFEESLRGKLQVASTTPAVLDESN